MESSVTAAVISGVSTVSAAVISGAFLMRAKNADGTSANSDNGSADGVGNSAARYTRISSWFMRIAAGGLALTLVLVVIALSGDDPAQECRGAQSSFQDVAFRIVAVPEIDQPNLREEPGVGSGIEPIAELQPGTANIQSTGTQERVVNGETFAEVAVPDVGIGWLNRRYLASDGNGSGSSVDLYRVVGLPPGDVLAVREDPTESAALTCELPSDAAGLQVTSVTEGTVGGEVRNYAEVQTGSVSGWVLKSHLAPE